MPSFEAPPGWYITGSSEAAEVAFFGALFAECAGGGSECSLQ
jgi:hypothetical protein